MGAILIQNIRGKKLDMVQKKGPVVAIRVGPGGILEVVCNADRVDQTRLHGPGIHPAECGENENGGCQGHPLE